MNISDDEKNKIYLIVDNEMKRNSFDATLMARARIESGPMEANIIHAYSVLRFKSLLNEHSAKNSQQFGSWSEKQDGVETNDFTEGQLETKASGSHTDNSPIENVLSKNGKYWSWAAYWKRLPYLLLLICLMKVFGVAPGAIGSLLGYLFRKWLIKKGWSGIKLHLSASLLAIVISFAFSTILVSAISNSQGVTAHAPSSIEKPVQQKNVDVIKANGEWILAAKTPEASFFYDSKITFDGYMTNIVTINERPNNSHSPQSVATLQFVCYHKHFFIADAQTYDSSGHRIIAKRGESLLVDARPQTPYTYTDAEDSLFGRVAYVACHQPNKPNQPYQPDWDNGVITHPDGSVLPR